MNLPDKFLLFVILYGAGVFTASFLFISWFWILLFVILICCFSLWSFLCDKKVLVFTTAVICFVFGVISFQLSDYYNQANSSLRWNGDSIKASGIIYDEPEFKESSVWLRVELKDNYQGRVLIKTKPYAKNFHYGDEISFEGKLEEPENFSDFDFKAYLSKEGIYSIVSYPKLEIIKNDQGSAFKSLLLKVKNSFEEKIDTILPEPESSFLGGLLLGERQSLDAGLKEKMQKSGTSHLVALSGYNITIICTAVLSLLLFFGLKRNTAFWLSVLFIIIFVLMTGASASVVRAGIMGGLLLLSQRIGRLYHPRNALFLAGIIMVLINPKILRFDFAFQLSFVATLGLIYFYPFFEKILMSNQKSFLNWRGVLATTLSAQLAVLPLIILRFGYFPLVSPLSNIFILSLIPITMLFGFLAGASGFIFSGIAMIFGFVSYLLLKVEILIINFFGSLKFAIISLDKVRELVFWIAMGVVILMFIYIQRKRFKYLKCIQ